MRGKSIICSVATIALLLVTGARGNACTNVIVSKGASRDGSCMVSYTADSHWLFGELYYHPEADWKYGDKLKIYEWDTGRYLGEIPQVPHTYRTIGNMNEYQVIIGETTYGGREELMDRKGGIDYGSLIYIALQRSKTAREAIAVMVELANTYGYCSEGETFSIADKNEAWVMDVIGKGTNMKNGVNINKGIVWVARRVPDGYICAHANQARIGKFPLDDPDNCLYAKDVINFARRKGYFDGEDEDFSFRAAYNPVDFETVRGCDARVWSAYNILCNGWFTYRDEDDDVVTKDAFTFLDYAMGYDLTTELPLFVRPSKKITVKELADVMRDHYEGTPMDMTTDIGAGGNALPYRFRPLDWQVDGKTYVNERAIATQQTGFWFVGQARNYFPDEVGGIFWFGVDDAATSYLTPIYTSCTKSPECLREGNGDLLTYSPTSQFWINNRISNACYKMYNVMEPYVRKQIDDFEDQQMFKATRSTDSTALYMYNEDVLKLQQKLDKAKNKKRGVMVSSDPFANVRRFLTNYSVDTAQDQFKKWSDLEVTLLVKFMDGNVKAQNPDGSFKHTEFSTHIPDSLTQPGYTDIWKAAVAKEHGDVIKVVTPKKKTE